MDEIDKVILKAYSAMDITVEEEVSYAALQEAMAETEKVGEITLKKAVDDLPDNATWEELDAQMEAEAKEVLKVLEDYTRRWCGEPCPDYDSSCVLCEAWKIVRDFKEHNCLTETKGAEHDRG